MRAKHFAALLAAAGLVACTAAQTQERGDDAANADSARAGIAAQTASMQAHFNAGHWDSVGQVYMDNAVSMAPNKPASTGRAAIVQSYSTDLAQMTNFQIHFTSQNLSVDGPIAVERGRYHFTANAGGMAVADSGKYLTHWHRVNGTWQIAEDIHNSDVPVAPAPRR